MKITKALGRMGPALIIACVVFGPGSLLVNANIGANYGYQLLWLLVVTGVLMGVYLTMGARIGVVGGETPCTLIAQRLGRPVAAIIGVNLCFICCSFQFANNLAVVAAVETLFPSINSYIVLVALNGLIILFLLTAKSIYEIIERLMKFMVGIILGCFVLNLILAHPSLAGIVKGLVPTWPESLPLDWPKKIDGAIYDPMLLIASLFGTTFAIGGAFFQGNLVREKGWTIKDYNRGIGDSITGVCVLTCVSMIIIITTATVIPGQPAMDIGTLAQSLRPLLGPTAHIIFCVGLLAVSMNPFLINAMIGGTILADAMGQPPKLKDRWPRWFTVGMLIIGMVIAILAKKTGIQTVKLIIFGQALTVLGNPLMAVALLWLANQKDIMGEKRNTLVLNILGVAGLVVVLLLGARVMYRIVLMFS